MSEENKGGAEFTTQYSRMSVNTCTWGMGTELTFCFRLSKDMHDLSLGRILAQSPNQVTTLIVSDFHLIGWCPVKQLESIFEVCEEEN